MKHVNIECGVYTVTNLNNFIHVEAAYTGHLPLRFVDANMTGTLAERQWLGFFEQREDNRAKIMLLLTAPLAAQYARWKMGSRSGLARILQRAPARPSRT